MDETELVEQVTKMLEEYGFAFVEKQLPPDLANAMKMVLPWMKKSADQAEGDLKGAILRVHAFLTKASAGSYPSPAPEKRKKSAEEAEVTEKARRMTTARTAAMDEGLEKMLAAYKQVCGEEALKALLEKAAKELPAGLSFTSAVRPTEPTAKSEEGTALVLAALKDLQANVEQTTKSLSDRLEKIEQTRPPSQGGGNEGSGPTEKRQNPASFANILGPGF